MSWVLMPLRRFADVTGRSRRMEFWVFTLAVVALVLIAHYLDGTPARPAVFGGMGPVELAVTLVFLIPSISLSIRRLHDSNKSGWWTLLLYLPWVASVALGTSEPATLTMLAGALIVGFVGWFTLMVQPGTAGENRFGPDPRSTAVAEPQDAP